MYKQFLQICRGLGFTPASVTEYPALEDVIFAVECGQAIAILPFRIREYMHTTGLAFVPLEGHGQTIELGVAWREMCIRDSRRAGTLNKRYGPPHATGAAAEASNKPSCQRLRREG